MSDILVETVFGDYLNTTLTLGEAIRFLKNRNLIAIGELAELAISKKSGIEQCQKNCANIDLVSGVQIKHAQTNPNSTSGKLIAYITIRGITAPILSVVTERKTNKQYFFHFPYSAYSGQFGNAFSVPFEQSGKPKRSNRWWDYEVESFEKLCELAHNRG